MLNLLVGTLGVWTEPFLAIKSHSLEAESVDPGRRHASINVSRSSICTPLRLTHATYGDWLQGTVLSCTGLDQVRHPAKVCTGDFAPTYSHKFVV